MKKTHLLLSLPLALGAMSVGSGVAHADLITAFNFNNGTTTSGAQAVAANLASTSGQPSTIVTNFPAADVVVFPGTTTNAVGSDGAGNGLALKTGATAGANNGDYIAFGFNTSNFQDIKLSYASQTASAANGFTTQTLFYSTNSTTGNDGTFTSFGSYDSSKTTNFNTVSANNPASFDLEFLNKRGLEVAESA